VGLNPWPTPTPRSSSADDSPGALPRGWRSGARSPSSTNRSPRTPSFAPVPRRYTGGADASVPPGRTENSRTNHSRGGAAPVDDARTNHSRGGVASVDDEDPAVRPARPAADGERRPRPDRPRGGDDAGADADRERLRARHHAATDDGSRTDGGRGRGVGPATVDHAGEGAMSGRSQYLLGLYIAEHRESPPVAPGVVGEMVGRAPATVIESFRQFEDEGLLTYEPYEGASLTEAGRRRAEELHETYVVLSWFFRSVLDLDEYETEAMEMAGLVSADVAERLAATLPYEGARDEN
jgi:DtxR family Mn-dependent transcriptional regulator